MKTEFEVLQMMNLLADLKKAQQALYEKQHEVLEAVSRSSGEEARLRAEVDDLTELANEILEQLKNSFE